MVLCYDEKKQTPGSSGDVDMVMFCLFVVCHAINDLCGEKTDFPAKKISSSCIEPLQHDDVVITISPYLPRALLMLTEWWPAAQREGLGRYCEIHSLLHRYCILSFQLYFKSI